LIPEALAAGLHVAIVTFSPQAKLIHEAIEHALTQLLRDKTPDLRDIMVRGGQRQIVCETGDLAEENVEGARKQKHIASVVEAWQQRGVPMRSDEIVLVDDDLFNVEEARDHGMRGALFNLETTAKLPRARRRGSCTDLSEAGGTATSSIQGCPGENKGNHTVTPSPKVLRLSRNKSLGPPEMEHPGGRGGPTGGVDGVDGFRRDRHDAGLHGGLRDPFGVEGELGGFGGLGISNSKDS